MTVIEMLQGAGELLLWIFLADLTTGFVHFWMDQYGKEDMPFVGKMVIEINILHHQDPRHMTKRNYWFLTKASWLLGVIIYTVSVLVTGEFSWKLAIFLCYAAQANVFHMWAHRTVQENGKFITFLQRMRLIQSPKHHAGHHIAPYDRQFCILTDWFNPILERIWFWEGVIGFFRLFGIQPIAGSNIRQNV